MKASLITVIAALASSAMAAPAGSLSDVSILKEATSNTYAIPAASPAPSSGASGHIVQDVGHGVNQVLTVTGPNAKKLLIELSPSVAGLLSGLGLPGVGVSVGEVVKTAASVGDLVKDLGPVVDGLLTVVSKDGSALLIKLSSDIAGLLSKAGLPGVGIPVGSIVATLGENLKRSADGQLVQDVAPKVQDVLEVTGTDSKRLLIQLSPSVASLLAGLGLPGVGTSVGQIIKTAGSVGDLLKDLGEPVKNLLTVVAQDGSFLLIQLSPNVAGLLTNLALPALGTSVGSVVATLGTSL
ncbi:hypothetical protein BDV32DRAFT_151034 [Aspergillus pseudonomiae]|uniref:Uncharacterized protein n=1 Tax=Aspergillus pseudonomiae TaxID=1506151 RepID=A0A5N7DAM8_9EURO|nr:uncharacterized protein BDV37DRAFT_294647 [Aspergillus pseudonomiae]KAB8258769.1 hypothetical protein BDV32DRAFT_151034 [Aspergillus pseudonomiae]KAE8403397.1 hypothetical protein BDV37DRAFT_294647 [Aspergillus pseudonomiae]